MLLHYKSLVAWLLLTALLCEASPKSLSAYSETRSFRDALDGKSMEDALVGPVEKDTSSYGDRTSSAMSMMSTPANGNLSPMTAMGGQMPMQKRMNTREVDSNMGMSMGTGMGNGYSSQQQQQQQQPENQMGQTMTTIGNPSLMNDQQQQQQQQEMNSNGGLERESIQPQRMSPLGKSMAMASMMRGMNGYGSPSANGAKPMSMPMAMMRPRSSSYSSPSSMDVSTPATSMMMDARSQQGSIDDQGSSGQQQQMDQGNQDQNDGQTTTMAYDVPLSQQIEQKSQQQPMTSTMAPMTRYQQQQQQRLLATAMAATMIMNAPNGMSNLGSPMMMMVADGSRAGSGAYGQKVARPHNTLMSMRMANGGGPMKAPMMSMMGGRYSTRGMMMNGGQPGMAAVVASRYPPTMATMMNGQKMSPAMVNAMLTKMLKANGGAGAMMMKNAAMQYKKMMMSSSPMGTNGGASNGAYMMPGANQQMAMGSSGKMSPSVAGMMNVSPMMAAQIAAMSQGAGANGMAGSGGLDAAMVAKMMPIMMAAAIQSQNDDAQQQMMMNNGVGGATKDASNMGEMGPAGMDKANKRMMNAMMSAALDAMMPGSNGGGLAKPPTNGGGYGSRGSRASSVMSAAEMMMGPADGQQQQGDMTMTSTPAVNEDGAAADQQQQKQQETGANGNGNGNYEQQQQQPESMSFMRQMRKPMSSANLMMMGPSSGMTNNGMAQQQQPINDMPMGQMMNNNGMGDSGTKGGSSGGASYMNGGGGGSGADMQQRAISNGADYSSPMGSSNGGAQMMNSMMDEPIQQQKEREPSDEENLKMLEVFGKPGQDFPIYSKVPETGFSCADQQNPGYYADPEAQCQAFYICQADGRQDGFLCPNATLFNQQYFVCDWWYNVDCSQAKNYYNLNADLYKPNGANFGMNNNGYSDNMGGMSGSGGMNNGMGMGMGMVGMSAGTGTGNGNGGSGYSMNDQQQQIMSPASMMMNGGGAAAAPGNNNYGNQGTMTSGNGMGTGASAGSGPESAADQQQQQVMMSPIDAMQMQPTPSNVQAGTYNGPMAAANGMRMGSDMGAMSSSGMVEASKGSTSSFPSSGRMMNPMMMQQQPMNGGGYSGSTGGATMSPVAINGMMAAKVANSANGANGPMYSSQRLMQQQPQSSSMMMKPMIGRNGAALSANGYNQAPSSTSSSPSTTMSPSKANSNQMMMIAQQQQQQQMNDAGSYSNDDRNNQQKQMMANGQDGSSQMQMATPMTMSDMGILGAGGNGNGGSSYGSKRASQQVMNGGSLMASTTSSPITQLMSMMLMQRNLKQSNKSPTSQQPISMTKNGMAGPTIGMGSANGGGLSPTTGANIMMSNGKTSPPKSSNLPMMTLDQQQPQMPTTTSAYDRDPDVGFAGAAAAAASS